MEKTVKKLLLKPQAGAYPTQPTDIELIGHSPPVSPPARIAVRRC